MIVKSDIKEFKAPLPSDFVVQQVNPFTLCVLQKRYVGRFCFDLGQAVSCFPTSIEVSRGETITGSLSVTVKGVNVSTSITRALQTDVSYNTSKCDTVAPVICFDGALSIFECERFVGFWSWKFTKPLWTPTSRGTISGNVIRNDPNCGCLPRGATQQTENAIRSTAVQETIELRERARSSNLLQKTDFRINNDAGKVPPDDAYALRMASDELESLVADRPIDASDGPLDAGVLRRDGSVMWLVGGDDASRTGPPDIAILSTGTNRDKRDFDTIRKIDGARLPILAVTRCNPDLKAHVAIRLGNSPDGPKKDFASAEMLTRTGQVTTMFASFDLAEVPAYTYGSYVIRLTDDRGCVVSTVQEDFVVPPVLGPGADCA